MIRGSNPDRG